MGVHGMRGGRGGGMADYVEEQKRRGRKTDARTVRRVIQAFKPYKFQVFLVLTAILATTLLGLINPLLIQRIFDDAIGKGNLSLLIIYVIIMFITPIISGFIGVWQSYLNNTIGQSVMRDFRNRLYTHLQSMSLSFFTSTRTGEIQSRLSNDVGGVQGVVTNTATSIVSNISTALSTVIAMFIISPLLTLVSLGLLPLFLWFTYRVGNVRRATSKETQKSMASLTAMMQETLSVSGILLMKTFGRQERARDQFEQENQNLANLEVRQQLIGRWFFMFIGTFFSVIPAIVYLIAGAQIINHAPIFGGYMTLGTIVTFTTLQSRIFFPIGQLLSVQVDVQGALALFDRIFEYLDMPIEIKDKPNALKLQAEQIRGEVAFDHVAFAYKRDSSHTVSRDENSTEKQEAEKLAIIKNEDEELRPALKNISFMIKPGQLAALVGPSGAGKTTMTYMVPRLYEVDSGTVSIDGHDVKDLALTSLSELIGMVTQETYLFHASIRENLLYARQDATDEEMIAAAKAAAIHERITELEDGYDTVVGERGYKLSGGEKQRIAIARVILKNPRILILDEATSALDTHSERLIQAALEPLMKGRTTLAIAHRLSTILAADVILVVNKGEIVERGTHQELLELGGLYARLYQEQFSQVALEEISAD
ncbi:multidrug ABC transporter ATPase [Ktedonobacter sp. SOSP1-52]|uniref:ABC transporter ATP-binding protein n=1 Tax=Ktedonobacter sp. SOSP1-52 TaxID=2778366 RepID=UPI00191518A7|nr:ABC transporter ATP-binding protein [Ktedonobacter sp. SOSP1-52]GHO68602.1 multidrug ABC transporter ATPase [Ktedonobacter sp. SOSP1-52]